MYKNVYAFTHLSSVFVPYRNTDQGKKNKQQDLIKTLYKLAVDLTIRWKRAARDVCVF